MTIPCQVPKGKGVTTIPQGSRFTAKFRIPKCYAPQFVGEDIVYSPNKYRETEGIKVGILQTLLLMLNVILLVEFALLRTGFSVKKVLSTATMILQQEGFMSMVDSRRFTAGIMKVFHCRQILQVLCLSLRLMMELRLIRFKE